jgi:hypothetical protein
MPNGREQADSAAANSAAGIGVPTPEAHQRPSPDAGAFLSPCIRNGRSCPADFRRTVRGDRKVRRSSGRYANRASSATSIGVAVAVSSHPEATTMQTPKSRARAQWRAYRILLSIHRSAVHFEGSCDPAPLPPHGYSRPHLVDPLSIAHRVRVRQLQAARVGGAA